MGYRLGVDLGTTYTAAAVCRDGRAEMLPLGDRSPIIPSIVCMRPDGTVLVGVAAERRATIEPERVAREFKRRIGDPAPVLLGGTPYGAETLQAEVLRFVVAKATELEGGPPDEVVLTHPANWGPYKQELIDQTIRLADLDPSTTKRVTEPEAAAIHYASHERVAPGSLIAVYDLGGGTFDAAVLRRTTTGYEILGEPSGIERLGGIDFDEAVVEFVRHQLDDATLDPDDPDAVSAWAALRQECVAGKETLTSDTDTEIMAVLPTSRQRIRLTRIEFEEMIRPAIERTVSALARALAEAKVEPGQLTAVLLVGGSSRIPLVAQAVGSRLGRPVAIDTHPKYAVALGAALVGEQHDVAVAVPPPEPTMEVAAVVVSPPPTAAPAPAPVSSVVTPPPVIPPPAAAQAAGAAQDGEPAKGRRGLIAVLVAIAVIAGALAFFALGGSDPAAASELVLEPVDEPGADPFTADLTATDLPIEPVSAGGEASGDTTVTGERGTKPGLYGGTRELGVCDPAQLVSFLTDNPEKGQAWATVQGIPVAEIGTFISGLTPVTLLRDTRVTNHGFAGGVATPKQSVLQAGTAVLVDDLGVPRAKCNCGNPLLEPEALSGSIDRVGAPWPGFDPNALVAVSPGADDVTDFVLTDIEEGAPFRRPVGTTGEDDQECDEACGLDLGDTSTTTTTAATTTTTASTKLDNLTSAGQVSADSQFDATFPPQLSVDGDVASSWFSAGPGAGGVSIYSWTSASGRVRINKIELVGNAGHANPDFRTGFGFDSVEISVLDGDQIVANQVVALGGTPDPNVTVDPGVAGDSISLVFSGHEASNCGGFAELRVLGDPTA